MSHCQLRPDFTFPPVFNAPVTPGHVPTTLMKTPLVLNFPLNVAGT